MSVLIPETGTLLIWAENRDYPHRSSPHVIIQGMTSAKNASQAFMTYPRNMFLYPSLIKDSVDIILSKKGYVLDVS